MAMKLAHALLYSQVEKTPPEKARQQLSAQVEAELENLKPVIASGSARLPVLELRYSCAAIHAQLSKYFLIARC
jgi:hypothetical protein